ncbi:BTAD domain-containing putative transcriptional regulator [Streptomyces sp. T-3]|nr:BTAD domain-containing putative transcriptional regulator [Streptomyces sp. T-3]
MGTRGYGQRLAALGRLVASTLVMGVLLVGIPYVLWRAAGVPWPERVYSLRDLTDRLMAPVSDPLMIQLLACFGWFCWLMFTLSVLREVAWYLRHLPRLYRDRAAHTEHLQAVSVRQSLAAFCVGTLVLALLGLWRPHVAAATDRGALPQQRPTITASAPVRIDAAQGASSGAGTPRAEEQVRRLEYTVVAGDTLWDIAAAHLDDPVQWPRIYALSKDRIQDDGGQLTDPDLILPGWKLTIPMPDHADPAQRPASPSDEAGPTEPETPQTTAPPQQPDPSATPTDQNSEMPAADRPRPGWARGQNAPAAISIATASVIGVTTAAGIACAVALRRRHLARGRRLHPASPPVSMNSPVPTRDAEELSSSVRTAVFGAHTPTRSLRTAEVDQHEEPVLHRITPVPPQPKGTVTIGTAGGAEISLDALTARGGYALTGPGQQAAARALIIGTLTAAERLRPDHPTVRLVLPRPLAEELLGSVPTELPALQVTPDTNQAITSAETHLIAHARHQADQEAAPAVDELTEAAKPEDRAPTNELEETRLPEGQLLLITRPDATTAPRLEALAARVELGVLTVISLGDLPGAHTITVTADGTTRQDGTGQLPDDTELFHLTREAADDVLAVIHEAHGQARPTPERHAEPPRPRAETPPPTSPTVAPATERHTAKPPPDEEEDDPGDAPTAPEHRRVRIQLLGPVTLWIAGTDEPVGVGMAEETREFLALLAAHPAGIRSEEIALELNLSEDSKRAVAELKNLRRAVRRTLRAVSGLEAEFIEVHADRYRLDPELTETDVADFTRHLNQATKASTEADRMQHLRAALHHYRGPFADGSSYPWSESIRHALKRKAGDATVRLAEHTAAQGDIDAALALLDEAITAEPTDESLYRRTISLQMAAGRDDAAQRTFDLLVHQLRTIDLTPAPATRALLAATPTGGSRTR